MKKIINYGSHYISNSDIKSVTRVLKSSNLTQGQMVNDFEQSLCNYFGSRYAISLSNGTAALHLGIKSLNLKNKDAVITSPITFIATASSILMNGLVPEFADINPETYTLDPNMVEDKIKKNRKIRAIIGVDYAGHPCDWEAFRYLKKKYDLYLINDNCHALGSKYLGKKTYAVKYADIVTQSYHAVKNFTTGEGGSVLTNHKKIAEYIKFQRSHGMIKDNKTKKKGPWYYKVNHYGYNYRLSDLQCALGISQLKQLDKFIKKRKEIADFYNDFFGNYPQIFQIPIVDKKKYSHSYHLYPLLINFKKINKNYFFSEMLKDKIQLQVHYIPLYKQPFIKKYLKEKKYFNCENFYKNVFSIPIFYNLNNIQQKYLLKKILKNIK